MNFVSVPTTMPEWKDKRLRQLEEHRKFFGREGMADRESWIVARLLRALTVDFAETDLKRHEEPVDVAFGDARFQVKEILDDERKRSDEIKADLKLAQSAKTQSDLLESYAPQDISFTDIVRICYERAEWLSKFQYGPHECKSMDLLFYFNWVNHLITSPTDVPNEKTAFRSLSVASNVYCAVASASAEAPTLLKENVGKAIKYFET